MNFLWRSWPMRLLFSLVTLIATALSPALAQDPLVADPEHHKLVTENDQVRVLHFKYDPGVKSDLHSHPDNVSIPLVDSHLRVTNAEGKTTESNGKAGDARYRPALKHAVENIGDKPYEGIIIELKCRSAETKTGQ